MKPLDLPVTIVTCQSYAHSLLSRYLPAARHPRGPDTQPFSEPALFIRDVIGRLSPASSCGRNPALFFSLSQLSRLFYFKYFYKSGVVVGPRENTVLLFFTTTASYVPPGVNACV